MVPDLQAFAPGAHVLPQQQVVECDRTDDVEQLLEELFDEVQVQPVLTHGSVEGAETLQQNFHCDSLLWGTGASLPQACRFGPQNTLDGLVFQHACHCTQKKKKKGGKRHIARVSVTFRRRMR